MNKGNLDMLGSKFEINKDTNFGKEVGGIMGEAIDIDKEQLFRVVC